MDKKKARELLKQALNEIPSLRTLSPSNQQFKLWLTEVCNILELTFNKNSREYDNFARAVKAQYIFYSDDGKQKIYNQELDAYETALRSAIHKCELLIEEEQPPMAGLSPKAFIAHEGETRALTILKEFLEALGIQYFIAESKASDGRSVERQVVWTQSKADFAICLATKGKAINKKNRQALHSAKHN